MALNTAQGFHVGSAQPIDDKFRLTKAEMLAIDENIMPDQYFCICIDDGNMYTFHKSREANAETGKFRIVSGGEGESYTLPIASETVLGGVKVDNTTIIIDDDGVISLNGGYDDSEVRDLIEGKLDKPEIDGVAGQILVLQDDGTLAYEDNVTEYDDTAIHDALALKIDKPEIEGTTGQILVLQDDGTLAYEDNVTEYDDTELRGLIDTKIDKPADGVENDILSLDVDGNPIWISNPDELPEYTADDIDKVLKVNAAGDGLEWSAAASGGGDATEMETTELTSSALGGIPVGEDLNGKTAIEILTMMLYPYVKPTISVTGTPNGGTFEVGDTQTITNVKVVIAKKSKKIVKVEVFDGATSLGVLEDDTIANGGTFNFPVNVEVASVNTQLTATVTDEQGSEVSSKTGVFTFVHPYYTGVCAGDAEINEALVTGLTKKVEGKATKTISYTTNNEKMVFAYPVAHGAISKIFDSNNFDVTNTFTRQEITITGLDGQAVSYYVYTNATSTVVNFNMKFQY